MKTELSEGCPRVSYAFKLDGVSISGSHIPLTLQEKRLTRAK